MKNAGEMPKKNKDANGTNERKPIVPEVYRDIFAIMSINQIYCYRMA